MNSKPSLSRLRTGSWVLYDLANTVYAATIAYIFVPKFLDNGDNAVSFGLVSTGSLILAGLIVPLLGVLCDRTGRARSFLALSTLVCVAAMSCISVEPEGMGSLLALGIANFAFQSALVSYNSLLPSVSSLDRAGMVSGIGTGLGYLGTFVTLLLLMPDKGSETGDFDTAIDAAALLFLIAALPCLLLVRDRRFREPLPVKKGLLTEGFVELVSTLKKLPRSRPLALFLLGNFCLLDVLNMAVLMFGDIAQESFAETCKAGELYLFGFHFDPAKGVEDAMIDFVKVLGLGLNAMALLAGLLLGFLSDRFSAIGVMRVSGWCLVIALVGGASTAGWNANLFALTLVPFGATALAGMWTAGRKVVLLLAPEEQRGEFYGLYGLTTKLSVIGILTFGILYRAYDINVALWAQLVPAALGLGLLHAVRIPKTMGQA